MGLCPRVAVDEVVLPARAEREGEDELLAASQVSTITTAARSIIAPW
jgi:hypothetical protein